LQPYIFARVTFGEVFFVRRKIEFSVREKSPTVVFANESPQNVAFLLFDERVPAVLANVIERFNAIILLPNHEDFLWADFFHLPIARVRQLSLTP
jgi:hypothetical protein